MFLEKKSENDVRCIRNIKNENKIKRKHKSNKIFKSIKIHDDSETPENKNVEEN